jgi:hypothetical protein
LETVVLEICRFALICLFEDTLINLMFLEDVKRKPPYMNYFSGKFWFLADLISEFFGVVFVASCPATSLIKMIH